MGKVCNFPNKVRDNEEKDAIVADLKEILGFVSDNYSLIEDATENEEALFRHFKQFINELIRSRNFLEEETTEYINTIADYQADLDVMSMNDIIVQILVLTELFRLFPRKFITFPDDFKDAMVCVLMKNDVSTTQYLPIGKVLIDEDLFKIICELAGGSEEIYDYYELIVTELDLNHKKEVVMPVILKYLKDVAGDLDSFKFEEVYEFKTLDDAYYVFGKCVDDSLGEDGLNVFDEEDLENLNNLKKCTLLDKKTKKRLMKQIKEIMGTEGNSDVETTKKVLKLVGDYYRNHVEGSKIVHVDFRR